EIGSVCQMDADIEQEGESVVTGRYLQEVSRNLPDNEITFEQRAEEATIHISSGAANFTLLGMASRDYPGVRKIEEKVRFSIPDTALKKIVRKTAFSCSTDESRPIFTGCLMELSEDSIRMVATNTHRLSLEEDKLSSFEGQVQQSIVPARILSELMHTLNSEVPRDVIVSCNYNEISFSFDNIFLKSRLIEGQFPDYHRVIPTEFNTRVTLKRADFLAAVNRVSLIARSSDYNIIRLEFGSDTVHISSNNPEIGNAEETVAASIDGPGIVIAFNSVYINDVLKNMDSESFCFSMSEPLRPAIIREVEGDEAFLYVITPVKTH
ncbi:MAG: DNA polymerase III subunit beta, partial [Schwartzia sp.]|nr:DNA polymerase III subunit beta [Schwartzia sp. (in: firmicutes)]